MRYIFKSIQFDGQKVIGTDRFRSFFAQSGGVHKWDLITAPLRGHPQLMVAFSFKAIKMKGHLDLSHILGGTYTCVSRLSAKLRMYNKDGHLGETIFLVLKSHLFCPVLLYGTDLTGKGFVI